MQCKVGVVLGENLKYHFPKPHPLNEDRYKIFLERIDELVNSGLVVRIDSRKAKEDELELFHEKTYIELVKKLSEIGTGYLDYGDTPAFPGIYDASASSAGSTLEAIDEICSGKVQHAFNPTGGLHHAYSYRASGFCVFNDICIGIEYLRKKYNIKKVLYVDIDAHHGDGVYYSYEEDADVYIVDFHEDGRFLFPGTGFENEKGKNEGYGKKLNIPLAPYAGDDEFLQALKKAIPFIESLDFEFIILQCGADGLDGDPITHLRYSERVHEETTKLLHKLAHEKCNGRLLALGGGGYNFFNVAKAWITVIKSLTIYE